MKGIKVFAVLLAVCCCLSVFGFCAWYDRHSRSRDTSQNVTINRINAEIADADTEPAETIAARFAVWRSTYLGCPDSIVFIPITEQGSDVFAAESGDSTAVCAIRQKGKLVGAVQYGSSRKPDMPVMLAAVLLIILCYLIAGAFVLYLSRSVIRPFRRLSEYPERLARMQTASRLPEHKSRYFGKYIWGMNMLADRLANDRRRISRLESERQTLLASIAHSVKTPVANIRLYASAIMTELYPESSDAEIAEKIDANAEKISTMVSELLETAATSLSDYEPVLAPFYLSELQTLTEHEFSDRMKIARVPFTFTTENDQLVNSDIWGLFRVISQLLENALKYGDGTGISVELRHQDDGVCIVVRNKGELLPEKELPYIFRSYWRGSNASDRDGSGIGLYTAHEIVKKLGGTILARRLEESSEMEFIICL